MKPLPFSPFEPAVWSTAKVHKDYLISDGKNKYSVPFDLIGEAVDIRLTSGTVEAFFHGSRVASFPRRQYAQRDPIVNPNHMPTEHRKYLEYNKDDFLAWGKSIGTNAETAVRRFLTSGREPEQGYKSCASLTKLADRYGHARLENACERVLAYSTEPTIRSISTVLKNGQDKVPLQKKHAEIPKVDSGHGITRGAAYFNRKGGASE